MVEARGIRKRYGQFVAVDGVDLSIESGSCFGLVGPNGAGKTTTISMLVGVTNPNEGEITFNGQPFNSNANSLKARIGYVPQDVALYEELTGLANLNFFGGISGLSGETLKAGIAKALDITGLTERATDTVSKYSGGMKRRLNIAAALLHDPDLIVLDEPTVGVDPQSRNAIFETLKNLQATGKTLIYTTHYMEEVEKLCDKIAIMDAGKIVAQDNLAGLLKLLPASHELTLVFDEGMEASFGKVSAAFGSQATLSGTTATINTSDLSATLATLAAVGPLPIERLQSSSASLEEVFLHLTGKRLRD